MSTPWDRPKRQKTLDESITENALLWVRRRVAARRVEGKNYFIGTLAVEMAPFMFSLKERENPAFRPVQEVNKIGRTVRIYLGLHMTRAKQPWRVDYVDAFCGAMGIGIHELLGTSMGLSDEDKATLASMDEYAPWLVRKKVRKGTKYLL